MARTVFCIATLLLFSCHVRVLWAIACPREGQTRVISSNEHGAKTEVIFHNAFSDVISIYWVGFDGNEQLWSTMVIGQSLRLNSYEGHVWHARAPGGFLVSSIKVGRAKEYTIHRCQHSPVGETLAQVPLKIKKLRSSDPHTPTQINTMFPVCDPYSELGTEPVKGFWVICASKNSPAHEVQLAAFKHAYSDVLLFAIPLSPGDRSSFRAIVKTALGLRDDSNSDSLFPALPDWTIWEATGRRQIHLVKDLVPSKSHSTGRYFLFEGGNFIWPGVRIGHRRIVRSVSGHADGSELVTMSLRPLVFEVHNFLSDGECEHIIGLAKPYMGQSVVNRMDGDEGKSDTTWRTSTTHFLSRGQTTVAQDIERRIFDVTRIPISHGEGTQVLRYEKTQHYYTHHDYFHPDRYQNSQSTLRMIEHGVKNRLATVFWYMSDVEKGGQTNFPRAGGLPEPASRSCNQGLSVVPKRGKVIIFYNMLADGALDEMSLHAGCSVEKGVKWAANKWLWNKPKAGPWSGDTRDLESLKATLNEPDPAELQHAASQFVLSEQDTYEPEIISGISIWIPIAFAMLILLICCGRMCGRQRQINLKTV